MTHPVYALTCGDVCGGSYSTDCSGCIEAGAGSAACVKNVCTWSTGNTCTDWCNAGSCVAGPCSGGYCQDQVCCVGHPQDLQVVSCNPGGGGGGGTCSPACNNPSFPYCCNSSCVDSPCTPITTQKPAKCSGITVVGLTPDSNGTYTLNKNQTYTLTVNYYWPPEWGQNGYLTGSVVYNPLVCTPVNSSTRANRAATNRVLIGSTSTPPLTIGWNYGITYNWTPTVSGNDIKVFCAVKGSGNDGGESVGTCPKDIRYCSGCDANGCAECHYETQGTSDLPGSWINVDVNACDANTWGACSATCGGGLQYNGCGDSRACNAGSCSPWWQVKDGDVTTNGDLDSSLPPNIGAYFDTAGSGGYPGIPAYGGATSLSSTNVSVKGWLANSGYNSTKVYNTGFFLNAIPSDTSITQVSGSLVDGSFFTRKITLPSPARQTTPKRVLVNSPQYMEVG